MTTTAGTTNINSYWIRALLLFIFFSIIDHVDYFVRIIGNFLIFLVHIYCTWYVWGKYNDHFRKHKQITIFKINQWHIRLWIARDPAIKHLSQFNHKKRDRQNGWSRSSTKTVEMQLIQSIKSYKMHALIRDMCIYAPFLLMCAHSSGHAVSGSWPSFTLPLSLTLYTHLR